MRIRLTGLTVVLAVSLAFAPVARAQTEAEVAETVGAAYSSILVSYVLYTTTAAAAVGLTIYGIMTTLRGRGAVSADAAEVFLRSNSLQLSQDLATGTGPALSELAAAAEIRSENLAKFGQLLRAHRAELAALADAKLLTPERAVAFMQRVGALIKGDAVLHADYEGFVARHG